MTTTGRLLSVCLLLGLATTAAADQGRGHRSDGADQFGSEVPVTWFDLLGSLIRTEGISPPVASRLGGYAGVALYEAVVPGIPGHASLAGKLNGLSALPRAPRGRALNWPAAANSALAATLRGLLAGASDQAIAAIDALEQAIAGQLRLSARIQADSSAYGRRVAEAVLAWAARDRFAELDNCPYTPPVGPGKWVPTPPGFLPPLQPCWGRLRSFVLSSADQCAPPPPPEYSTSPESKFYAQALEVYRTSQNLTQEQRDIALFWADDPTGHWAGIVGKVATDQGLTLDVAALAYAKLGIASADAFIATWATKYLYNLLRPITYLRMFFPGWSPLLVTPPFPEYTSGHSVHAGAVSVALTALLGEVSFEDDTQAVIGLPPRSFASFDAAAREDSISRLYGGVHYRAAINNGLKQGNCIGEAVLAIF